MEKKFYVYTHHRATDGSVFYVGKGRGNRAWSRHSRSDHWYSVVNKHGFTVSIVMDGVSEKCAFTLEKIAIYSYRKKGFKLVNFTDGGEGTSGARLSSRKQVFCSNGMVFESVGDAAKWAGVNGSKISSVCNNRRHSAGGFSWWFAGEPDKEYIDPLDRISKSKRIRVSCSGGVSFDSISDAVAWLKKEFNTNASSSNISYAISGKIKSAYGFSWWRTGNDAVEYVPHYERVSLALYKKNKDKP